MRLYIKTNKNAYNTLANEYKARLENKSMYEEPLDSLVGRSVNYAKERFGKVLALDIGPGRGESVMYMQKEGCTVDALDVAEKILEVVKEVAPRTNIIHADILEYKIPKERYALIYCGALIHLFKATDAVKVMETIWDGLKPKGILFINTTIHDESSEGYYTKSDYKGQIKRYRHKFTEQEFNNLIKKAGFHIIDEIRTNEEDRNKMWLAYICEKII